MKEYKAILEPDSTYHIYNRANGSELLFAKEDHFKFFLEKYRQYISPIAHTFCHCLMPNHFHFLLRLKGMEELMAFFNADVKDLTGFENLSGLSLSRLLSRQFSHFFNSYTKAFNKQQGRQGSLFNRPFKRKRIIEEKHLRKLVHYIHYNPVVAGLCDRPEEWQFSSWRTLVSVHPTYLKKEEVIAWFDDMENLVSCHRNPPEMTGL